MNIFFIALGFLPVIYNKEKIDYFMKEKGLQYINAFNDNKGFLFLEFYNENKSITYFIGKNPYNEEVLLFNGLDYFFINKKIYSLYHDSIAVNVNNNTNIFSINIQDMCLINLKNESISYGKTINLIDEKYNLKFKNLSLTRLKNDCYLLNVNNYCDNLLWLCFLKKQISSLYIFNFNSVNINEINYSFNKDIEENIEIIGCFQTDNQYIQCSSYSDIYSEFMIQIFSENLTVLNQVHLIEKSNIIMNFKKIYHIKGEIGGYLFFKNYVPILFIEKLNNDDFTLNDLFQFEYQSKYKHYYINIGKDNLIEYEFDLISDVIKINDSKFAVIFSINNGEDLEICLFDLYNSDTSLKIRYYIINLILHNIKIYNSLKAFAFKNYLGIAFYNSLNEYPGYMCFNYPNITSNNRKNYTTIEIKLFFNSSISFNFPIYDNLEIINNLYRGEEKIKIINYYNSSNTGVIIKSSISNSEIYPSMIIDINDTLIFEQNSEGVIPGIYILEFIPLIIIIEDNGLKVDYYGNSTKSDITEEYLTNEVYKLIYIVEYFENCNKLYKFINEPRIACLEKCPKDSYIYTISETDKYCLISCEYETEKLYKDETNNICYKTCSDAINGNIYLFNNEICVKICPENYYPDKNGTCILGNKCEHYYYFNEEIKEYICTQSDNCPINYNYFNEKEKECLKKCPQEDMLRGICKYIEGKNETIISKQDEILNSIKEYLINNFDTSKLDNEEDIVFEFNDTGNIIYTISTTCNQKNSKNKKNNKTTIDLTACEERIKMENEFLKQQCLYMLKLDIIKEDQKTPDIEYELYYYPEYETNLALVNLSVCEDIKIDISIPIKININDIDKYNTSSAYYNDVCNSFMTGNGTDITLKDRQKEFAENKMSICENGCEFIKYNYNLEKAVCSCNTKTKIEKISEKFNSTRLYTNFKNIADLANLEIIECAYLLFTKKEIINNSANYIMMSLFLLLCIALIIFICRDYKAIKNLMEEIVKIKKSKEKKNINIQTTRTIKKRKKKPKKIKNFESSSRTQNLINNSKKKKKQECNKLEVTTNKNIFFNNTANKDILSFTDSELNLLPYEEAIKYDTRTYCQYYISLIRTRHILFFSFFKGNDYNIRMIKIYLFFFTFATNYSCSILFYNYETMHKIYEDNGKFDFIYQIPQIICASIITGFINSLITKLGLCEEDILTIKNSKKENCEEVYKSALKSVIIKFSIFFIINFILLAFYWIYSISFCVVYKNTQIHLLKDVVISFATSFIKPFIIYLFPGIFRIPALSNRKNNRKCLYNFSKLLQSF